MQHSGAFCQRLEPNVQVCTVHTPIMAVCQSVLWGWVTWIWPLFKKLAPLHPSRQLQFIVKIIIYHYKICFSLLEAWTFTLLCPTSFTLTNYDQWRTFDCLFPHLFINDHDHLMLYQVKCPKEHEPFNSYLNNTGLDLVHVLLGIYLVQILHLLLHNKMDRRFFILQVWS